MEWRVFRPMILSFFLFVGAGFSLPAEGTGPCQKYFLATSESPQTGSPENAEKTEKRRSARLRSGLLSRIEVKGRTEINS